MPQFKVVIPSSVGPGDIVRINAGPGTVQLRVPKGGRKGNPVYFELTDAELNGLKAQSSQKKVHEGKMQCEASSSPKEVFVAGGVLRVSLRRKIVAALTENYSELGLVLLIGTAIGISILTGFVSGILYATRELIIEKSEVNGGDEM